MFRRDSSRYFFTEIGGKSLIDEVRESERQIDRFVRRHSPRKRKPGPWRSVGRVESIIPYDRGVRLACENAWVELRWVASDCLRVRLRLGDGEFIEPFSYAVNRVDWSAVPVDRAESPDALELRSPDLICRVGKSPFRLALAGLDGHPVCLDTLGMQFRDDGALRLSMAMQDDESAYGLGMRATSLNLRGKRFTLWNRDPLSYTRDTDPLYCSIPFYLGVHQYGVYGLFWDNSGRGTADLGAAKLGELTFEAEAGELRYYLFVGRDLKSVLARYTELTGRIRLPALWSLGYHQSRVSYYPQESVTDLAAEFRQRSVPCDVIHLDLHYMSGFRSFTWDETQVGQFRHMVSDLHSQGFKVVAVLHPGIKIDNNYRVYRSGLEREVFLKYPDGSRVAGTVWAGLSHFPDFTHPAARAWWAEQLRALTESGVDGIWNEMGEASTFTTEGTSPLPDIVVHDQDGLAGNHLASHNVYGMLMGRATAEGLQKHRPGHRPLNILRAGFAGAQRFGIATLGDSSSDWDHLRLSISMALNMGLSGVPLVGPDVGGVHKGANGELFTRWLQAACLMPFFRARAGFNTPPQEPWAFGQPYEVINRVTIELRYRLLPYLYSVVALSKEYGWPVIRPLFMADLADRELRNIDDCFLLGDTLLVAPVVTPGALKRTVRLPAGEWYDFWTSDLYQGSQVVTVPAPLERLPLFVRAGGLIPLWPEMFHVGHKPVETLVYRVFPGEFETVLYEDAGEGLDYEKGDYRWIYATCGWDEDSKLVINRRVAGRYVPPYTHIRLEVVGFDEEPTRVRVDRQGAPLWFYDDGLLELTVDDFQRVEITRKSLPTDRTVLRRNW